MITKQNQGREYEGLDRKEINSLIKTSPENVLRVFSIFLIIILSATLIQAQSLGTWKQGECVNIKVYSNLSSINISTVSTEGKPIEVINEEMDNLVGNTFNYTYCDANSLGKYNFDWYPCNGESCQGTFDVTPSGNSGSDNIIFIVFVIVFFYALNLIGFFGKNEIFTILTGMGLLFLGVYLINNGIIIYRDNLTLYISYITIAWGFISAFWASYSLYEEL